MSLLRHPATRFVLAGLLLLVVVVAVTSSIADRAAEEEALTDARSTTGILARGVAEPALPRGLARGRAGAADRFGRAVGDRFLTGDVRRVKVWSRTGVVVWSDASELIGEQFDLGDEELEVLARGGTDAEVSDLGQPENRFEVGSDGLVEVYTRIRSPEGDPLLFEAYFAAADIERRKEEVLAPFLMTAVGGPVLLLLLGAPVIWVLARRADRVARDREQLLRRSMDASASERRRIARDLHDGVVQDLAGTAFSVAAIAQDPATPPAARKELGMSAAVLRTSLRSLRSLLVSIHPPDLRGSSLHAALTDLAAPAVAVGIETTVSVIGADDLPQETAALVWRAAQEAVRNAIRHSSARHLEVRVDGSGRHAVLEIVDDGVGFAVGGPVPEESFGLRGLASLVSDAGGRLDLQSAPGRGTTIRVEVPR